MNAKNKNIFIAIFAFAALIAIVVGCWFAFGGSGNTNVADKTITIEVVLADGTKTEHVIKTNEPYLRGALDSAELIEGDEGDFGLFITSVDGTKADDAKQEWWCITKGGAEVTTGVDTTPIADGDTFELTLMQGY